MSYLTENWFLIGTFAALAYFLLLRFGPHVGYRYRTERTIRAPLDSVRTILFETVDTDGRFGMTTLSQTPDPDDPDVVTYTCRNAAGMAFDMRMRTLDRSPLHRRLRVDAIRLSGSGVTTPFPMGEDHYSVYRLSETPEGVRLVFETFYRQRSPWNGLVVTRRTFDRTFDRIQQFCETGTTAPVPKTASRLIAGLNLLSAGAMLAAFGPGIGLTMIAALLIHEFGHAIGFRLVGERVIGIRLVPFLGAVALGSPPPTAVRKAVVSLAGVAFSLLPILLLMAAHVHWRLPITGAEFDFAEASSGALLLGIIKIAALVNAFQLVPVPVFDGGETLSAAFSGLNQCLSVALIALAGVATAGYVASSIGVEIGLLVLIPSLASLSLLARPPMRFPVPTGWGAAAAVLALYAGAIGAYAGIVGWAYDQHPTAILRLPSDDWHARAILQGAERRLALIARDADPCPRTCSAPALDAPKGLAGPEAVAMWEAGPLYWPDTLRPGSKYVGPRICHWCSRDRDTVDWPD